MGLTSKLQMAIGQFILTLYCVFPIFAFAEQAHIEDKYIDDLKNILKGDYSSQNRLEKTLRIFETPEDFVQISILLATIDAQESRSVQACERIDKALQYISIERQKWLYVVAEYVCADALMKSNKYDAAMIIIDNILAYAGNNDPLDMTPTFLLKKALLQSSLESPYSALYTIQLAYDLAPQTSDKFYILTKDKILLRSLMLWLYVQDYKFVKQVSERLLASSSLVDEPPANIAAIMYSHAYASDRIGEPKGKVLGLFERTLNYSKQHELIYETFKSYLAIALRHISMSKLDEAANYIGEVEVQFSEYLSDPSWSYRYHRVKLSYAIAKDQAPAIRLHLEKINEHKTFMTSTVLMARDFYKVKQQAHEKLGNYSSALESAKKLNELISDEISISGDDRQRRIELVSNLNTSNKELKFVEQNNQILAEKIDLEINNRNLLITIFSVSIVLLILAFITIQKSLQAKRTKYEKKRLQTAILEATDDLKQANIALRQEKSEVEKLNTEKNSLFEMVAHEIKNPLTHMLLSFEHLVSHPKKIQETQANFKEMLNSIQSISNYTEQILALRDISVAQLNHIEKINIFTVTNDVVNQLQLMASKYGNTIKTEINKALCVDYSSRHFSLLLSNLVSNAIKHSASNGPIIIQTAYLNTVSLIKVVNSGHSMPSKQVEVLLSDSELPPSNGLGLAFVKYAVKQLNGSFEICSPIGGGCEITIYFDGYIDVEYLNENVEGKSNNPIELDTTTRIVKRDAPNKENIIVIDDDPMVLDALKRSLNPVFNVHTMSDPMAAFEEIKTLLPDCIITDEKMPIGSGIELARRVKSNEELSTIPLVMLTADTNESTRIKAFESLIDAYVTKPVKISVLYSQLRSLIGNRQKILNAQLPNPEILFAPEDDEFIRAITGIISAHYHDPNFEWAPHLQGFGIQLRQFQRKLKRLTSCTPKEFLQLYRIEKAKQMLEHEITFEDIASRTGFTSSMQFRRYFKKHLGLTPLEMRKQLQSLEKSAN